MTLQCRSIGAGDSLKGVGTHFIFYSGEAAILVVCLEILTCSQ